ncbi:uncharacterized protein N7473_001151 [Penicillium subrubescens]|uniref:Uncharacterized protein n=1 Tax=Penicillium subrubescens TaxID=1316194 RepID=A0A1Q5UPU8_9EURO|nr:uncharacterized protein N7473_001151 [Penicillium subrubescens]KAJ5911848.1 hypothetical protein N7473_001151 [Penicillium subrubescens]OKP14489.1 hypothetical protein PENSUB_14015 [Penicillium subrubescens]
MIGSAAQLSTTSDKPATAQTSQGSTSSQRQTEPDELPRGPKHSWSQTKSRWLHHPSASEKAGKNLHALGTSSSISVVMARTSQQSQSSDRPALPKHPGQQVQTLSA